MKQSCIVKGDQKAKVRNGQWKGGEIPKGHFVVCDVHVVSETTLSPMFFVSIVCVLVQNLQLPTKNLQQF